MEATLVETRQEQTKKKVTLDDLDWDDLDAKTRCSIENGESCEMCQG